MFVGWYVFKAEILEIMESTPFRLPIVPSGKLKLQRAKSRGEARTLASESQPDPSHVTVTDQSPRPETVDATTNEAREHQPTWWQCSDSVPHLPVSGAPPSPGALAGQGSEPRERQGLEKGEPTRRASGREKGGGCREWDQAPESRGRRERRGAGSGVCVCGSSSGFRTGKEGRGQA